jgi:thioredoxin-like negative regulator of GroEL
MLSLLQMVNRKEFVELLQKNKGVIVVLFSATWCKPCQTLKPYLGAKLATLPSTVTVVNLDVNQSNDLYAHLKSKKQVRGVPVALAYKKGNLTPYADRSVSGANIPALDLFFGEFIPKE